MNVLEIYQKNVFSSVSSCPIHPHTTIPKVHRKCSLCLFREFSKLPGDRLWCDHVLVK